MRVGVKPKFHTQRQCGMLFLHLLYTSYNKELFVIPIN